MKTFGFVLLAIGATVGFIALNIDTTVATGIGSQRVHNIGLMEERRIYLGLASLLVIVAVLMMLFTKSKVEVRAPTTRNHAQPNTTDTVGEPVSMTPQQFFERERTLSDGSYQLYLVKKFAIERNETLGKFVMGAALFDSIDDALRTADAEDVRLEREYKALASSSSTKVKVGKIGQYNLDYAIYENGRVVVSHGDTWSKTFDSLEDAIADQGPISNPS